LTTTTTNNISLNFLDFLEKLGTRKGGVDRMERASVEGYRDIDLVFLNGMR
jgi:hypothetical protein